MISVDKVIAANLPQLKNSPKVKGIVKKGLDTYCMNKSLSLLPLPTLIYKD
jgi:hypothetical protein